MKRAIVKGEQPASDPVVHRTFSTALKKQKVEQIERKLTSVFQVARELEVSRTSVYRWIELYGSTQKAHRIVVELESEQSKTEQLRQRLSELERAIGRKQMELDYYQALVEEASQQLGTDLKKTFGTSRSSDSGASTSEAGR
jgi:transposase-like protein